MFHFSVGMSSHEVVVLASLNILGIVKLQFIFDCVMVYCLLPLVRCVHSVIPPILSKLILVVQLCMYHCNSKCCVVKTTKAAEYPHLHV